LCVGKRMVGGKKIRQRVFEVLLRIYGKRERKWRESYHWAKKNRTDGKGNESASDRKSGDTVTETYEKGGKY